MYEMYPDAWPNAAHRQLPDAGDKPRRRVRRDHSVIPPVASPSSASRATER